MTQEALTIDATIGGALTNSYLTLAAANTLIHQRPFHSAWDSITDDDEKKAALIYATRILSSYNWRGNIADTDQAQAHPRSGMFDNDAREYSSSAYPEWLTVATSELAFFLATEDRLADSGTEGFSKIKVASIAVEIDKYDRPVTVPDVVLSLIKPWLFANTPYNAQVLRV